MRRYRVLLLFSFSFFPWAPVATAQPTPIGDEFQINTDTGGNQTLPRAAVSSAGDFVVTWTSDSPAEGYGVLARFYDDSGEPLSEELRVQPVDGESMGFSDVAMGPSNEAVLVWRQGSSGPDFDVDFFGQRYSSDGSPLGSRFRVNETNIGLFSAYNVLGGRVAMSDSDRFVVVWENTTNRSEPDSADIYGRVFDATGDPLTGEFIVHEETEGIQVSASVDMMPSGEFVVSWLELEEELEDDFGALEVYARQFDANGHPLSGDLLVRSVSSGWPRSEADVAYRSDGSFTLAWMTMDASEGELLDIEARSFDPAGNPRGDAFLVHSITSGFQAFPTLDFDDEGNLLVSWTEVATGLGRDEDGGIAVRQFSPFGEPLGEEALVNTTLGGLQGYSNLVSHDDGRFLVTWRENKPGREPDIISARLFEAGEGPDAALVGHWPLDEGRGDSAFNAAGNGLDGALEQGAGWTAGQQGSAGIFDGIDDSIRVADAGATQLDVTDALTVALWVRPDLLDGSMQVLVSKDNAYEIEIGKQGARRWNLRLNNETVRVAEIPLEEGVWQHLAMTWDGTEVCSYFNGWLDGCSPFMATLVPNDSDLGLGARPSGILEGGPVFPFDGALDEVYVYNRAFAEVEVAALVLAEMEDLVPPSRSDLQPALSLPAGSASATLSLDTDEDAVCRWDLSPGLRFDDMANAFTSTGGSQHSATLAVSDGTFRFYVRCRDAVGNTNGEDATIAFGIGDSDICGDLISHWDLEEGNGCSAADAFGPNAGNLGPACPADAPEWVAGRGGASRGLGFDGIDRVEVVAPTGFSGLSGITVAAWVRHDPSGKWRSIIDHRENDNDGYDLFLNLDSRLFLRVNDLTLTGNRVAADGQWHHVVGTYDGAHLRLYVDGVLDEAQPAAATSIDVSGPLFLGRRWNNDQNPLAGVLDEVTVLGRGLSDVEVLDLYGGGLVACTP